MSFTLRQITQRASGGEIVRTREVEKTDILVGRGTECDLQLPDLAVALRHARMIQTTPGRVAVEGLGGQTFEVDGRFVERAELDLSRSPQLVFGGHVLTLTAGAAPGEVVISVVRAEAAEAPSTLDAAVRALSPGTVGISKRGVAWLLGIGIVLACLAWPIGAFFAQQNARIHADQQWSSGPLSHAHAFLGGRCQACHQQAFVAVRDEACLTCHRAGGSDADRLKTAALIRSWGGPELNPRRAGDHADHSRLLRATPLPADWGGKIKAVAERAFNHPSTRCASCHLEHMEAGGKVPTSKSRPESVPDIPALTPVRGCVDCHAKLKSRLPDTDLIDTASWSAHPQFRPVVAVSLAGPRPTLARFTWRPGLKDRTGLTFSHQDHLSTTGGVARMAETLGAARGYGASLACVSCHRPDGKGFKPIEMARDCGACHSLAYGRANGQVLKLPHGHPDQVARVLQAFYANGGQTSASAMTALPRPLPQAQAAPLARRAEPQLAPSAQAEAAVRAAFSPGGTCFGCHAITQPRPDTPLVFGVAPVRLSQSFLPRGGFDHGLAAHVRGGDGRSLCADCHAAATSDSADDLLVPGIEKCAACHGKTKRQTPAPAGSDCAECHSWHAPDRPQAPSSGVAPAAVRN